MRCFNQTWFRFNFVVYLIPLVQELEEDDSEDDAMLQAALQISMLEQ